MKSIMPKKRGTEIQIARGRLKGVLQDLVAVSDDENSDDSDKKPQLHIPTRGRPPKRLKREANEAPTPLHESFIMKLFDRSLDLAKYKETTALYPICRAWIANMPRSSSIKNLRNKRTPSPEVRPKVEGLLQKYNSGEITEITSMPAPKSIDCTRIPSPLPEQLTSSKDNIKLDYDLDEPLATKEELLSDHRKRWGKVKNKWNLQSKTYQQRYVLSYELLDALYKS